MTGQSRSDLEVKLRELEDKSSIQLVVATVKSLEGSDVESYANQLFRFWKLGEARKNNGVLLLVAPAERKVRIEVGYGLEGTLTDAYSSVIISSAIIPRFKTGDFSGGIERGVDGITSVLSGDTAEWQPKVRVRTDDGANNELLASLLPLLMIFVIWYLMGSARGPASRRSARDTKIRTPVRFFVRLIPRTMNCSSAVRYARARCTGRGTSVSRSGIDKSNNTATTKKSTICSKKIR